ncbi:hypothetical protein MCEMSE15_00582 [Fimbriimonadaceae bacterium]
MNKVPYILSCIAMFGFAFAMPQNPDVGNLRFPSNMFKDPILTPYEPPTVYARNQEEMWNLTAKVKQDPRDAGYLVNLDSWMKYGLFERVITEIERYLIARNVGDDVPANRDKLAEAYIFTGKPQKAFETLERRKGAASYEVYMASLAALLSGKDFPDQKEYLARSMAEEFEYPKLKSTKDEMLYNSLILLSTNVHGNERRMRFARWASELAPGDPYTTANYVGFLARTKTSDPKTALKLLDSARTTNHARTLDFISAARERVMEWLESSGG